ncbi:MAG: Hpt domain-containing protein [Rhodobacteraceae bacterium]|nr:Hpt domain-containing protein [Paracoccaceae bacterium]
MATATHAIAPALLPVRARFMELMLPRIIEFERLRCRVNAGQEAPLALEAIGALAHKISGVADTFGMSRIGNLSAQVDRRISAGRAAREPLASVWDSTEPALEALLDAMEAQLDD